MMQAASEFNPIFVHASMRGGSTYFFNVLRRNPSLMCFNEAIDDSKRDLRYRKLVKGKAHSWNVNHAFLDRDDDAEFFEVWDEIACPSNIEMRDYFSRKGSLPD